MHHVAQLLQSSSFTQIAPYVVALAIGILGIFALGSTVIIAYRDTPAQDTDTATQTSRACVPACPVQQIPITRHEAPNPPQSP